MTKIVAETKTNSSQKPKSLGVDNTDLEKFNGALKNNTKTKGAKTNANNNASSQIHVFYAIDHKEKNLNESFLNSLVDTPDKIVESANKAGKTITVDTTATKAEIIAAYENPNTERIVIVAHGAESHPLMADVNRDNIEPGDFDSSKKSPNLNKMDILSCHQHQHEQAWEAGLNVDVDPHDDAGYSWFWEMNHELNDEIPKSIHAPEEPEKKDFFFDEFESDK